MPKVRPNTSTFLHLLEAIDSKSLSITEAKSGVTIIDEDVEAESESDMKGNIRADVLKVGHHGSSTSTSDKFLRRVSPDYALISCATDNPYGHPHRETLKKLASANIEIYRTDLNGSIVFTTDGNTYEVSVERN